MPEMISRYARISAPPYKVYIRALKLILGSTANRKLEILLSYARWMSNFRGQCSNNLIGTMYCLEIKTGNHGNCAEHQH
jgi:hypothetical protein